MSESDSSAGMHRMLIFFLLAASLVNGLYNLGIAAQPAKQGGDFAQYYVAARLVRAAENTTIYDRGALYQHRANEFGVKGIPYEDREPRVQTFAYPPLVAYLMVPLSLLPYDVARYVFFLLSLAAFAASVPLLVANREKDRQKTMVLTGWAAVMLFYPVFQTLYLGQINAVLLFLCILALHLVRRRRIWLAGLLFALAAHVKFFPLVLLPFFLVKQEYRLLGTTLLFVAVIAAISVAVGGLGLHEMYFSRVLPQQYFAGPYFRNQGFSGFFERLLTRHEYTPSLGHFPRLAHLLSLAAGLAVLAATYVSAGTKARAGSLRYDLGFATCLTAALLFQSKSYEHQHVFLLPAFLFSFETLVYRHRGGRALPMLLGLSFSIWSFLLKLEFEYKRLPRTILLNPMFSVKFFATLMLWAVCVRLLTSTRGPEHNAGTVTSASSSSVLS